MSDTIQAMIFKNFNDFQMERVPKPKLTQPDELLVKVLACSICGTDVNLAGTPSSYGSMNGRILGHEIVGEVVQTGSNVTRFSLGDRVVVNPNSYCGVCCACRQGYVNHCENMELTIYGSFIIKNTMPKAIQLIESGVLELDAIVTHVLPLEQLMTGIELIRSGTGMKVILKIPE